MRRSILILATIPVGLFILSLLLISDLGPYYLGRNQDPEYVYLINSLNILNFSAPHHVDHPGTTLHVLSALVILGRWLLGCALGSCESLIDSVLRDPEKYLRIVNIFLNILIATGVFLVGLKILRACKALLPALAFQITTLLFFNIYKSLTRVSPEPLLVFAVFMLILVLIPEVFAGDPIESSVNGKKRAIITGIALGFGVVTKVTFLPLILIILLFQGFKKKKLALIGFFGSFIFFTLPIISKYNIMFSWLKSLFVHTGRYGSGSFGVIDINQLPLNLKGLILNAPFLFISLGFYMFFYFMLRINRAGEDSYLIKRGQRLLWIGCLVIFVQIAITVKHPGAHYLLSAMVFTGLLNAFIVFFVLKLSRRDFLSRFLVMLISCFLIAGFSFSSIRIAKWSKVISYSQLKDKEMLNSLNTMKDCFKVGYYRTPQIEYALALGNYWSDNKYVAELMQLYPDSIFYNIWSKNFYSYNQILKRTQIITFLEQGKCIVLVGRTFADDYKILQQGLTLKSIKTTSYTTLYRLEGLSK